MTSSFLAKLVLAVVAVYLLLGAFPATSTLLPQGGEKSTLSHVDCRDGLRKIIGREEGSFGCQSKIVSKKIVPIRRSLRLIRTSSPPSPIKSQRKSQGGYAPPPLIR